MSQVTGRTRQFTLNHLILAVLSMLLIAACSDSTGPERTPTSIQLEAAQFNLEDAGTLEINAAVLDQSGAAFDELPSGTAIEWTITDPDVATLSVATDSRRVQITGEQPGQAQLTATSGDLTATATISVQQVAAELELVAGDGQTWYAGEALEDSVVVRVLDRHGDPVAGAEVTFAVTVGEGVVAPATVTADDEGYAATVWTLGSPGGSNTVEARAGELEPVIFTATAVSVGTVSGRVVAPNGITPVPGAVVSLEEGQGGGGAVSARVATFAAAALPLPTAVTDVDGRFTLEKVPVGKQRLVARRGLFVGTIDVDVAAGETVEVEPTVRSEKQMAYVPGSFDRIEGIVEESLGQEIERISRNQLSDASVTDQFGAIFLNCGASIMRTEQVIQNLLAYVNAGGLLYVSDLELPVVQAMFPDAVLETGSGDSQLVTADVVDEALREGHLGGQETVEIHFDLSGWQTMLGVAEETNTLLRGDIQRWGGTIEDTPLAIEIAHGEGRVVYTSFHNSAAATEDQIAVLEHYILGTAAIGAPAPEANLLRLPSPRSGFVPAGEHRLQ